MTGETDGAEAGEKLANATLFFTEPSRLHGFQPDRQPTAAAPPVGRDGGDTAGSADMRCREKRPLAADPAADLCDMHTILETQPLCPPHASPEPPGPASLQHQSHGDLR